MSWSLSSVVSGAALGAALTYASVTQPRIILDQFAFKDMHMIRAFMTATAGSAYGIIVQHLRILSTNLFSVITTVLSRLKVFTPYIRPPISLGLWSRYDGNIIGGLLIGTGMAITGACPGSVIPQLAIGVPTAWPAFLGAISGGLLWVHIGEWLHETETTSPPASSSDDKSNTFHGRLGISHSSMLLLYISACLSVVYGSQYLDSASPTILTYGIKSGLAIAAAQAISILATSNALCSSGSFEETARWLLWSVQRLLGRIDSSHPMPKPPPCSNTGTLFAVGEFLGAIALARVLDLPSGTIAGPGLESDAEVGKLFLGGLMLGFGARLAGGCTSGHGISGMSAFSCASLLAVCCMFGGGMGVAAVIN